MFRSDHICLPYIDPRATAITRLNDLRTLTVVFGNLDYAWLTSVLSQVRSLKLDELVLNLWGLSRKSNDEALEALARGGFDDLLSRKPFNRLRTLKIVTCGSASKAGELIAQRQKEARARLPQFFGRGGIVEVEVE